MCPLKTSENLKVFWCFQGVRKATPCCNGLISVGDYTIFIKNVDLWYGNIENRRKLSNRCEGMLAHLFPMHPFPTPENIRKPDGFQGVEKRCIGNKRVNKSKHYVRCLLFRLHCIIFLIYFCNICFYIFKWWFKYMRNKYWKVFSSV